MRSSQRIIDPTTAYTWAGAQRLNGASFDGQVPGYDFNAHGDGNCGLLANARRSFDDVRVKTDDPAFANAGGSSMIAATAQTGSHAGSAPTQAELDTIATVALAQWAHVLGDGDPRLAALGDVHFRMADLSEDDLGRTEGNTA